MTLFGKVVPISSDEVLAIGRQQLEVTASGELSWNMVRDALIREVTSSWERWSISFFPGFLSPFLLLLPSRMTHPPKAFLSGSWFDKCSNLWWWALFFFRRWSCPLCADKRYSTAALSHIAFCHFLCLSTICHACLWTLARALLTALLPSACSRAQQRWLAALRLFHHACALLTRSFATSASVAGISASLASRCAEKLLTFCGGPSMRHRFSTWKMTPVLGVVKADLFVRLLHSKDYTSAAIGVCVSSARKVLL